MRSSHTHISISILGGYNSRVVLKHVSVNRKFHLALCTTDTNRIVALKDIIFEQMSAGVLQCAAENEAEREFCK